MIHNLLNNSSKIDKYAVEILIEKAWSLYMTDANQCLAISNQALSLAQSLNYEAGIALALRNLGELHNIKHEYEQALTKAEKAINILKKNKMLDHSAIFDLYLTASAAHVRLGNLSESLSYCYLAEKIALIEANVSRQAAVYKTTGNVHLLSGNFENALANYTKARAIFESLHDIVGETIILNNMCHCYHQAKQYEKALEYGLNGLAIFEKHEQTHTISSRVHAYNLNNVGQAYLKSEMYLEAEPYFTQALDYFKKEEDIYGEIYSWRGLGEINLHQKYLETALFQLGRALELSKKSEIAAELVKSHFALAMAHKSLNNFKKSLFHFEQFYHFEKRILNDETERKIRNLEATYRVEKAQKEAEIYQLKNVALQNEIKEREKAQLEAEKATKSKSEFLANMSHEIRTPLNGVIGITELLFNSGLNEQQLELTNIIKNSGENLLRIINDILDFSKIDAGKLELEIAPFSPRQAIEGAIDLLASKASQKELEIGYVMRPEIPNILVGDELRFQQIIANLLSNGIKFTQKGEVFVFLDCHHISEELIELHVEVRDTGMGIPAERIDKLFKSFNQVNSSITRQFGGTGLGLAISKQLAELMGGRIWVESVINVGTSFHFTIHAKKLPSTVIATGGPPNESGKQVLVVDESENCVQSIACKTAVFGTTTLTAHTHQAAFETLKNIEFDAILIDTKKSDNAGSNFAKKIQDELGESCPPLIALTPFGENLNEDILFAHTVPKPIRYEALHAILTQEFSKRGKTQTPLSSQMKAIKIKNRFGDLKILMAEDNHENQKVATLMLSHLGCTVDIVENGVEAVNAVQQKIYDLIIMDIQMPLMDGIEATKKIRTLFSDEKRPYIVAVTANVINGERERLLARGLDDFVGKPLHLDDLTAVLKHVSSPPPQQIKFGSR